MENATKQKSVDVAVVSMSRIAEKFPRLEHCCEGLCEKLVFHPEIHLFLAALKKKGFNSEFFDGGLIEEESILEKLEETKPSKIVYYLYTPYIKEKSDFLKKLSKISKLYLVIVPYFWKNKILKEFPFVDDVFFDGEKGFGIDASDTRIDYEKIDLSPFLNREYSFPVVLSKYCPYQCTYCVAQKTGLMERDLKIVEEELRYLKRKGVKRFSLLGNNLTMKKDRFIKICNIMKEIDAEWSGDGRIDHMAEEMYQPLKESKGTLLFGVESANQEILNKIKKRLTIKQIIDNADEMTKREISFRYTFMFGFPWDSAETADEMIKLRKRVGALNYHCLLLSPLPGTSLFEEMVKLNLIREEELDFEDFKESYFSPFIKTLYLTKKEVGELVKKIMVRGAFNKSVLKDILKKRKISAYPSMISKGMKLLLLGKRM